jgi:hypothetical protein
MDHQTSQDPRPIRPSKQRSLPRRAVTLLVGLLVAYLVVAYVLMPTFWKRYARRHPALDDVPGITETGSGMPGDPLNVALIGTEAEIKMIMAAAERHPADPRGLCRDQGIAAATVRKRPYDDAPVSDLYLWGRKEDLAFEQRVGDSPRQRHHVRLWLAPKQNAEGRPIWVGAAIFDERVGVNRMTGQITHFTAPDIDAERDYLFKCLEGTGDLSETYAVDDFHKVREGKNGGGDPWSTDGRLLVGAIAEKK